LSETPAVSKVIPISTEAVPPGSNGDDMIVTLRVADLRAIVRQEVKAIVDAQYSPTPRIVYPLKEAAEMLSVPSTWLAARARAGEIKCVRLGHYVTFAEKDLREYAEKMKTAD
jgi:hypothetical protein